MIDVPLQLEIEQFLYREARLMDEGRLHEWLELFSDDLRYWVPIRETLQNNPEGIYDENEIAVAHMDDDKRSLTLRVKRLDTGLAHAETPASRVRHMIANVEVERLEDSRLLARSNFLIFQGRREHSEFLFSGKREDTLVLEDGSWRITRRKVLLDHTVLPRAISIFF
ncbi:MAG: aromatic-ring-hydroxylating dioxygenase subunit beta [Chloroflexi bacterium]|nr:aromatic-ring-hydroxylating dioxygenase subunit beta [Chloroflexota bacterium]